MRISQRRWAAARVGAWSFGLVALVLNLSPARADNPAAEGQCITVRSPLGSEEVNRLREVSTSVLDRAKDRANIKLIYDFNPDNKPATTAEFGPCNELAEFLLNLRGVTTVAFVHGEVARHFVLPVLACKELVLSVDARLGPVVLDADPPLTETKLQGYKDVIKGRSLCPALVLKLLDRDMEVLQASRKGAVWYIDAREPAEERQRQGIVVSNPVPVLGRGSASFSTKQAQTFGLCQRSMETRQEVARAYDLPPTSLREDSLIGQNPVAWCFTVSGPVTPALAESLQRHIKRAVGNPDGHANLIVLQLGCAGGDPGVAQHLAEFLHELKDDRGELGIKTVAYLPGQARGTAALLALGCSEIVMKKNEADLGDLSLLAGPGAGAVQPGDAENEKDDGLLLQEVKKLAEDQGYPTVLVRAMVYPSVAVHEVVSRKGQSRWALVNDAQLRADQESKDPEWTEVRQIKPGSPDGKPLVLTADMAAEVRLARYVVDDLPSLYSKYGVKEGQVHTGGADWLDDMAYVLRLPAMSIFLVMLGITCLILELKIPGIGLPGVVAAVCFVLFFWAHAYGGHWGITALAIMLFLLGLVLIGVEIFVMPGVAVVGISGALLIVASLTLVTLEKWPQTSHEWLDLGGTMATFAGCLIGSVIAALVLAWYLPNIPYVNRLILKPPGEVDEEAVEESALLSHAPDLAPLLGAIGVAATPLRPAGKVRFGDEFVDVVAEGSYVPPGARVQVIEIEGYRVVVKEV
jgi:membrane-bound ClpP family serine protease